jgi:hypothetical protein
MHQPIPYGKIHSDIDYNKDIFKKFERVFSGYNSVNFSFSNITSIGSPLCHDLNDINQPNKGFLSYDFTKDNIRKIETKYPKTTYIKKEVEPLSRERIITKYAKSLNIKDENTIDLGFKLSE